MSKNFPKENQVALSSKWCAARLGEAVQSLRALARKRQCRGRCEAFGRFSEAFDRTRRSRQQGRAIGELRKIAFFTLALFVCTNAFAGPARLYGYDAAATGSSGMPATFGADLGALHYNPALVLDLPEGFSLGVLVMQPFAEAHLMEKPLNSDVPLTLYDSDVGLEGENLDRPLPTVELYTPRHDNTQDTAASFLALGLSHSFGLEKFCLGLYLLFPTDSLAKVQTWYPDERDQYFSNTVHFVRFAEWNRLLAFMLGAAYRPLDWLRVGAAAEGSLLAAATLDAFVPEATVQDYALANMDMKAGVALRGIVGFSAEPVDWLRLSLVWRDRRYMKIKADAWLKLWNFHESGEVTKPKLVHQRHTLALDFEPMEISFGAGARLGAWQVEASVTWEHWADYLDPHHQRGQQTAVFDPVNEGDQPVDGSTFAFSDTFSLAADASWRYLEGFLLRAGLCWYPSPVPPQVGRTSYLDNDILALGLGHRFERELWGRSWWLEVGLKLAWLLPRTVYKDPELIKDEFPDRARTLIGSNPMPEAQGLQTNNPGFPGYDFEGWTLVGALSLGGNF